MQVTPAILAADANDLLTRLCHSELRHEPLFHLDVLVGSMFASRCFADPRIIASWGDLPRFELHLMTADPLGTLSLWAREPSLFTRIAQVIVHAEIPRPLEPVLLALERLHLKRYLALSPETPVEVSNMHLDLIDGLVIMGVQPGAAGQAFSGEEILAKIRRAHRLFPALALTVDGGVTRQNIADIGRAGAQRCIASSAVWQAPSAEYALQELRLL